MVGQQCEFLVVVEDRGARARAVIRQAEALGQLFMQAGKAQKVGVFRPDHREGPGIGAGVALGERIDQAIGRARHLRDPRDIGLREARQGSTDGRSKRLALVLRDDVDEEIRVPLVQRHRVAGDRGEAGHEAGNPCAIRGLAVRGHACPEADRDADRHFPAPEAAFGLFPHKAARAAAIFVPQRDAHEVFGEHPVGIGDLGAAIAA